MQVVDLVLDFSLNNAVNELWYIYSMQAAKIYHREQAGIKLQPYFFLMTSRDGGREDELAGQVSDGAEEKQQPDVVSPGHIKQKHFTKQPLTALCAGRHGLQQLPSAGFV